MHPGFTLDEIATAIAQKIGRREPERAPLPIKESIERYAAWQAGRKEPASWRRDRGVLERFIRTLDARDLAEITPAQITSYISQQATRGRAPKTQNRTREVLHTMFAWFVESDELEINPVRRVRRAVEPAPVIRALSVSELDALLERLRGTRLAAMVATIACAGLRRGEAVWLHRDDIDLHSGAIRIRAKHDRAWQPKTKRNRSVPISPRLRSVLESEWTPGDPWAFPAPRGGRWDGTNLHRAWRALIRRHGWTWTFLDLRHTFATLMVSRNVSLAKVSALMGNSPEICRRHYAHISTEDLRAEVDF